MILEPLFLEPVFKERIWGGKALKDNFGYSINSNITGECWAISGHPHGQSVVKNGVYKGWTIEKLWKERRGLFGNPTGEVFPLLVKILDANKDLSVQVHPDDAYAMYNENGELGKTECWYIIDCKEDAKIVYGHRAQTKAELMKMIEEKRWESLLNYVPIKPGDFYFVPSGTVHALCEGTLVLEVQQSSDTTYRVYDYEREDENGALRELHLNKAIDVINVPFKQVDNKHEQQRHEDSIKTTFVESEYFTVHKWSVKESYSHTKEEPFLLCSVIGGEGKLLIEEEIFPIKKGDHFILPDYIENITLKGELEIIVSHL
ncbi:mannose-6-phosphate isomerase [Evansella vedderi]|uniref:Mannose-6-phosphate isomerase n=1 Tax=Evansella vedderi TaxID=38282 RepID=A0ABT9ZXB3_9BACI|nr:mannose-6-phosphate isomerase, class I [Evansella vedderi]MDQ0255872.1 mannose-6-phosphate isomerase [Evansella vedderi]